MALTPTPLPRSYVDHVAGLRYLDRLGPEVPALNVTGLDYIRQDLLARAAGATAQADRAFTEGDLSLMQRAEGIAGACRDAAAQIVRYALDPVWQQQ